MKVDPKFTRAGLGVMSNREIPTVMMIIPSRIVNCKSKLLTNPFKFENFSSP